MRPLCCDSDCLVTKRNSCTHCLTLLLECIAITSRECIVKPISGPGQTHLLWELASCV